jgi:hypothetical protein
MPTELPAGPYGFPDSARIRRVRARRPVAERWAAIDGTNLLGWCDLIDGVGWRIYANPIPPPARDVAELGELLIAQPDALGMAVDRDEGLRALARHLSRPAPDEPVEIAGQIYLARTLDADDFRALTALAGQSDFGKLWKLLGRLVAAPDWAAIGRRFADPADPLDDVALYAALEYLLQRTATEPKG